MLRVILYISFLMLGMFIGTALACFAMPTVGTITRDSSDPEKDIYTILLSKDPEDLHLRDGGYYTLKFRNLKSKK